jgi:hypothetical protein
MLVLVLQSILADTPTTIRLERVEVGKKERGGESGGREV